jgi:hypothetical protein
MIMQKFEKNEGRTNNRDFEIQQKAREEQKLKEEIIKGMEKLYIQGERRVNFR